MTLIPHKKLLAVCVTILSVLGYGVVVFSAQLADGTLPPSGGYNAGDSILQPGCAPGSLNCFQNSGIYIGQKIIGGAADQVLYTDNSGNVFGDAGFMRDAATKATTIDTATSTFFAGDVSSAGNGTVLYLDDGASTVGATAVDFGVNDGQYSSFFVHVPDDLVQLGDIDDQRNSTLIEVNDTAQTIIGRTTGTVSLGDTNITANGTRFLLDDVARSFTFGSTTTDNILDISFAGKLNIGLSAGKNTSGTDNISIGKQAGIGAVGATYQRSVSIGAFAGTSQDAKGANTLIGWGAGSTLTGGNSVMLGYEAGANTTSPFSNVIIGYQAGKLNSLGSNNMFLGALAGQNNTSGSFNVALGDTAGANNETGSNNIFIGSDSAASAPGLNASIAIGRAAQITASNQMVIGSTLYPINDMVITGSGFTSCSVNTTSGAGISCSSDERLKKNITDLPPSTLETLTQLRTVTYNWKEGQDSDTHIGFIAQNLQSIYPQLVSTAPNGYLQANYAGVTPLLVEAVRELDIKIKHLESSSNLSADSLISQVATWLSSAGNGIQNIFAHKLTTEKICVADANGETCLDRSQVDEILSSQSQLHSSQQVSNPVPEVPVSEVQVPVPEVSVPEVPEVSENASVDSATGTEVAPPTESNQSDQLPVSEPSQ
jgi:hypothetical protein